MPLRIGIVAIGLVSSMPVRSEEPPLDSGEVEVRECLVVAGVGQYPRSPLHQDAIEAQIVVGEWGAPKEGDEVTLPDGSTKAWGTAKAEKDGWFRHPALGGDMRTRR